MINRAFGLVEKAIEPLPKFPESLELDACYRYCEAMARARHHNFPVASRFVPSHLRKHIWAVYAFARGADDFADEPQFEGRRSLELDRWEQRLEECFHGESPEHPVFVALLDTIRRFDLPITPFSALITGFRTDLETKSFATYQELRSYTSMAAQPVGQLFLYLSGIRDPSLLRHVDELANALAEAKFWQDMAHDLEHGRCYVPTEDLRHFSVTPTRLQSLQPENGFGDLVHFLVARTRSVFMRARPLVQQVGDDIAVEMAISWHGGMRILDKIDSSGSQLLTKRPQLNNADKAVVVSKALAWRGGSLPRRLWL
jgi:squalene synthase HpnC